MKIEINFFDEYSARNYSPDTGRFLSEDPIKFSGGDLNLYRYVENDPVSYGDPFGLKNLKAIATVCTVSFSAGAAIDSLFSLGTGVEIANNSNAGERGSGAMGGSSGGRGSSGSGGRGGSGDSAPYCPDPTKDKNYKNLQKMLNAQNKTYNGQMQSMENAAYSQVMGPFTFIVGGLGCGAALMFL